MVTKLHSSVTPVKKKKKKKKKGRRQVNVIQERENRIRFGAAMTSFQMYSTTD